MRTSPHRTARTATSVSNTNPQPGTYLKPRILIVIGAVVALLGLVGCATPFRAPPDMAHIKLERVDSSVVMVEKIWLEREKGQLVVTGYVVKRLGVTDTTQTHLAVTLFDADGRVLRNSTERFEPSQIPSGRRMYGHARYRVVLDPLPPATARIEVRAHEVDPALPRG